MGDRATALERETLVIRGVRSELKLEGGVITILKQATTQASPTQVVIPVRTVRGATVEAPRRGGRGWLHIASTNGSPAPVGELSASGDPYALPIKSGNIGASRKLARMIDKHVRERGLPGDVGPNQGRFTSGVVVTAGVKAIVRSPMVTMEEDVPVEAHDSEASAQGEDDAAAPTTVAAKPRAAAKKPVAKKPVAKKATGRAKPSPAGSGREAVASDMVAHLRELGELHKAGVLSDAEFASAKAKILG